MTWEIADRDHPERPGPRYATLQRAADVAGGCEPGDRFYVRLVGHDQTADGEWVCDAYRNNGDDLCLWCGQLPSDHKRGDA